MLTSARVHLLQEHRRPRPPPLGLPEAAPWQELAHLCLDHPGSTFNDPAPGSHVPS